MQCGYSHQDWDTVVLNKTKPQSQRATNTDGKGVPSGSHMGNINKQKQSQLQAASSRPAWKIEQKADDPDQKPVDYVSKDLAKAIVSARVAMKLKQKDLAVKMNMSEREIHDIEAGKAVENKAVLAKIKRFLNIRSI